jgi:hypothetical protein
VAIAGELNKREVGLTGEECRGSSLLGQQQLQDHQQQTKEAVRALWWWLEGLVVAVL